MKEVSEMNNGGLKEAYNKGKNWLVKNEQITGTDKNAEGKRYDGTMYVLGLRRIEKIEDELRKRKINYA